MRRLNRRIEQTLLDTWQEYIRRITLENYSQDTIDNKIKHFRLFMEMMPNDILINEVKQTHADNFILAKKKTCKAISINSYIRVYRAFFNWAYKEGYMDHQIVFKALKEQNKVPKSYQPSDIDKALKKPNLRTCTFNEYRNWVIVNFVLATGARRTTIVEIQIGDLNLEESCIEFNTTKNNQPLVMPLSTSLKKILVEYLSYRNGDASDPLFCLDTGAPMTKDYLTNEIAKYNKSRGLTKTSLHAYRHTFSKTAIMDCNMNAFQLQKMLGHANIKTTENYVKMFDTEILNNVDEHNPLNYFTNDNQKSKIKTRGRR